jgi:EmrB/QacA subfamily drug resistance transporter
MSSLIASPPVAAPASWRRWLALPTVLAGTFMVVLDFFIVNVAMPSLERRLHAGAGAIEWVVAGYALTSAVLLIPAARLGDGYGRRRVFAAGLALFTLASAACGLAASPAELVAGRLVQGVGAALIMPNVLAIIGVSYTGTDRLRAMSAYALTMGLAAVGGQIIGGALISLDPGGLGWRACFLINLPLGCLALALAPRTVPESQLERPPGLDPVGTVLLLAGLLAIVLPLLQGRSQGWPAWTWLALAGGPVLLASLLVHERRLVRRGGDALVDPAIFARRAVSAGLLAQLVFWSGQASFFLVLALYLQDGRGLTPLGAGLVFTVLAGAYLLASAAAPGLAERHGRRVLTVGASVLAGGHGSLLAAVTVVGGGGSVLALAPGLMLAGAGMGLAIAPLATLVLAAVPEREAGSASGLLATAQNVGNAIGVAVIGAIYFGAASAGVAHAFRLSLAALAIVLAGVAALTQRLPRPGGAS